VIGLFVPLEPFEFPVRQRIKPQAGLPGSGSEEIAGAGSLAAGSGDALRGCQPAFARGVFHGNGIIWPQVCRRPGDPRLLRKNTFERRNGCVGRHGIAWVESQFGQGGTRVTGGECAARIGEIREAGDHVRRVYSGRPLVQSGFACAAKGFRGILPSWSSPLDQPSLDWPAVRGGRPVNGKVPNGILRLPLNHYFPRHDLPSEPTVEREPGDLG
jgi:hypothetical protein